MAKTAQEKADAKAEKLYKKTHKRKYQLSPGDILFTVLGIYFIYHCMYLPLLLSLYQYDQ